MAKMNKNQRAFWKKSERFLLSREELRERYGPLIDVVREGMAEQWPQEQAYEQAHSVAGKPFSFAPMMVLIKALAGPQQPTAGGAALAMATRSAGERGVDEATEGGKSVSACANGTDCRGILKVFETEDASLGFAFALEDENGKRIRPFFVTVVDGRGKTLVDQRRIDDWEGRVEDVEMDTYTFVLTDGTGKRTVTMGVEPEES